jgi:hypothetical protein
MTSGKRDWLGLFAVVDFGFGIGVGIGAGATFYSARPTPAAIAVWMSEIPILPRNARRFMTTPPVA